MEFNPLIGHFYKHNSNLNMDEFKAEFYLQ